MLLWSVASDESGGGEVIDVDLIRTRVVLAELQAAQERLGAELEASGLTDFVERSEWLIAHRSPLDVLAAELHEARLAGYLAPWNRSVAKPKRRPKFEPTPAQLAIARASKPIRIHNADFLKDTA